MSVCNYELRITNYDETTKAPRTPRFYPVTDYEWLAVDGVDDRADAKSGIMHKVWECHSERSEESVHLS